jgi:hypothetical protein
MACEQYHEALIEVALGARELHPGSELSAHLERCAACRGEMDAQRRLAAAIDLGVAAKVAAEPSPEFAERIRQRISCESAPAPAWWLGVRAAWMPLTAGALAVALLVFWLARREVVSPLHPGPQVVQVQKPSSSIPATPQASSNPGAPPHENSASVPVHASRASRGSRAVQSNRTTEPEVLVFPGEREAVLQFYALLRSGRADFASLMASAASLEIPEITIQPLEVKPLPESAAERRTNGTGR